ERSLGAVPQSAPESTQGAASEATRLAHSSLPTSPGHFFPSSIFRRSASADSRDFRSFRPSCLRHTTCSLPVQHCARHRPRRKGGSDVQVSHRHSVPTTPSSNYLAMALARLSKGVRAHEEAVRRAQLAFLRRMTLLPIPSPEHAKSLGA